MVEVALYFQCTTTVESMDNETISSAMNVTHQQKRATHIVTETHYGLEGLFIFRAKVKESKKKQVIIEGIKNAIKTNTNYDECDLSCTFNGSFSLQKEVKTIQHAISFCSNLQAVVDDSNFKHIPIKAKLSPIKLDVQYMKIDSDSCSPIRKLEQRLQDFQTSYASCSDIVAEYSRYKGICKKIEQAQDLLASNAHKLQENLAELLHSVRVGDENLEKLDEAFEKSDASYFNKHFPAWIIEKEKELAVLEQNTAKLTKNKGM